MRVRDLVYRTLIIVAVLLGLYLTYRLINLITVLFVAIIFASTVRPILKRLVQARIPRPVALTLIYLVSAVSLIGLLLIAIPPITALVLDQFESNAIAADLNFAMVSIALAIRRQFEVYVPIMMLPPSVESVIQNADQTMQEQAWPFARGAIFYIGQLAIAVVISVYWLVSRQTALSTVVRLLPIQYRGVTRQIWIDTETTLGAYFRGQVILAVLIGLASYVGLVVLRIPNAIALAILAGLLEFIPILGPVLAAIPAILIGLTVSPLTAVFIAVWYAIVQQVEGNYLVPKVMHESLGLHPMIVLLALLAGVQLNGIVGGLLAIPIAGALQVTMRHLWNHRHTADTEPLNAPEAEHIEGDVRGQEVATVPSVANQAAE